MRRFGVLASAVVFVVLPVMACAAPNAAMTPDERECCKKMADQCGHAGMAKSHSCCETTATPDFNALKTASPNHFTLVLFHPLPLTAQAGAYAYLTQRASSVSCTHSPPGLASTGSTILRI